MISNIQLFVLHIFMHFPAHSLPLWDDYTIVPSRYAARGDVSSTETSDLRGGIGSLWSVNEGALGMWVQGLEMEPGKRRKRRKRRAWDKGHFCRRHQQASYPLIILGKWAENPWLNIWPLQKCPFPPLGAWMGGGESQVLKDECFCLFWVCVCLSWECGCAWCVLKT